MIRSIEEKAPAISVDTLSKTFSTLTRSHRALDAVSLNVEDGEMVGLIGASGSGKSTLLRHLAGLVTCDSGSGDVIVLGEHVQGNGRRARDIRRIRRHIGFIFQQFNLVNRLSLLTNVLIGRLAYMPAFRGLLGVFTRDEKRMAMAALERVGIAEMAGQRAGTLSGGQQQRAAIARAMIQEAGLLLADEPIASLDPEASRKVMQTLLDCNERDGTTVVVCLHQVEFAKRYCRRIVGLKDGRIHFDGPPDQLDSATLMELYGAEADDAGIIDGSAPLPGSQRPNESADDKEQPTIPTAVTV